MDLELYEYFPIWNELNNSQQMCLRESCLSLTACQGAILHRGSDDCSGLVLIRSGQLRAYILSNEGREITLYRLLDRDICLFSASCIMNSIQFDIMIEAEKDTEYLMIPSDRYQAVMKDSAPLANFTNELMSNRFSEVMWLMEQILWKSFDKRLASFLLEQSILDNTDTLKITHEVIGNHMGNPREVVTRMLRHFQGEGYVRLSRGTIELMNTDALKQLADS